MRREGLSKNAYLPCTTSSDLIGRLRGTKGLRWSAVMGSRVNGVGVVQQPCKSQEEDLGGAVGRL